MVFASPAMGLTALNSFLSFLSHVVLCASRACRHGRSERVKNSGGIWRVATLLAGIGTPSARFRCDGLGG